MGFKRAPIIIIMTLVLTACATTTSLLSSRDPGGKPLDSGQENPAQAGEDGYDAEGLSLLAGDASLEDEGTPETLKNLEASSLSPLPVNELPQRQEQSLLPAYDDIWERIRENLAFERHLDNRAVKQRIDWYARNQDYLNRVAERARPYIHYIVEQLEAREMPLDLALLPVVESAYHPFAYSRSHASGIWQFIPGTGRIYGLKQNWWYDGRRDIVAATRAALDYLEKLYAQFGDWEHALASYNSGEMNVARAIKRNLNAKKPVDFFSLRLPRETRGYVPSLLAVAEIVSNPDKYGITLEPIPDEAYFEIVDTGGQIDLSTAAELTGLGIDEIYTLNPGFNRWATDPDGPHYLAVPLDKKDRFIEGLAAIPSQDRVGWARHVIQRGETLSQIADRYRTSISTIKQVNELRGNLIRTGHSLIIPSSKEPLKFYTLSADNRALGGLKREGSGDKYIYTVQRGDSLWIIGRRYQVSVKELCAWNGINSRSILRPGQKLNVWIASGGQERAEESPTIVKAAYTTASDNHVHYTVKRGDSLWLISRRFGVTVSQLQEWNKLTAGKLIHPGQQLVLYVNASSTGA